MPDVKQDPRFNAAAKGNQNGGEGERYARHQNQRDGNGALLDDSPGLGQLVGTAKSIHPRNDDAGSAPDRQQRSGDEQPNRPVSAASEVSKHGGTARWQNSTQCVGNLAQVDLAATKGSKNCAQHQQGREKSKNRRISRGFGGAEGVVLES